MKQTAGQITSDDDAAPGRIARIDVERQASAARARDRQVSRSTNRKEPTAKDHL
jgi:hypothetical protein